MLARRSAYSQTDDLPTVHRWARTLTVVYSVSLVALVAFVLVSHQYGAARMKTAEGVKAASVTRP